MQMEVDGQEIHVLVEMRAGLMHLKNNVLAADPRKGLLRVFATDDTLVHVAWYERQGAAPVGAPVSEFVVFPGECSLVSIPGQARCYELKFPDDSSRNMFFWLQVVSQAEDTALVTAFNAAVNGQEVEVNLPATSTPAPQQQPPTNVTTTAAGNSNDLAALLNSALSAAGAGASTQQQQASGSGSGQQLDADTVIANLLRTMAAGRSRAAADEGPGLHEVLKPDLLVPAISSGGQDVVDQLAPHLPPEHRTMDALLSTLRSPQFQQQLAIFSAAMQTGQLDLAQFGLNAKGFSVADFLEAIQDMVDREQKQS